MNMRLRGIPSNIKRYTERVNCQVIHPMVRTGVVLSTTSKQEGVFHCEPSLASGSPPKILTQPTPMASSGQPEILLHKGLPTGVAVNPDYIGNGCN